MKAPIDFEPDYDTADLTPVDMHDLAEWHLTDARAEQEASGPPLRRGPSIFDDLPWPKHESDKPPPLPCIAFTRTQVLLYNLRAAGYDLSQVAANDNGRLEAALEVVLCRKRGLEDPEQIARAIGISVDAVVIAVNDLHLAAKPVRA